MRKLIILLTLILSVNTHAEESKWSDFGNITNESFLDVYLGLPNADAMDIEIDRWIDGWVDGMFSLFVYEAVLDTESADALSICVYERFPTPSDVRKEMLRWGSNEDVKDIMTSKSIYYAIRFACEHVLGEVNLDEEVGLDDRRKT